MKFEWYDYDPQTMPYIEQWLDESTVKSTGLDEGFCKFYECWVNEDDFVVGQNFWCKVVCEHDRPFAVIAFCQHNSKIIIMEMVIDPQQRNQGKGSKLLKELLARKDLLGFIIQESEAVIYPSNIASQKAFENAGFQYHHTHEDSDGISLYYTYKNQSHS
jgi:GNAT superfamily N-acetyltransferase